MIQSNIIWTSKEVSEILNVQADSVWSATGVSIDARNVEVGDLFIALVSDNGDGHDYIEEAFKQGAVAAIVSKNVEYVSEYNLLKVDNTFEALKSLGCAARKRCGAKIISVLGCLEETGVKDLLVSAFSTCGQTHMSTKSYGNNWGVPLSLARMHAGTDFGIFELSVSYGGDIEPFGDMLEADIFIVPKISDRSLESELSEEAKKSIFKSIKKESVVVLDSTNDCFDDLNKMAQNQQVTTSVFSDDQAYNSYINNVIEAANGSLVKANILGTDLSYSLQVTHENIALNSISVLATVRLLGQDLDKAITAIKNQKQVTGRNKYEFLNVGDKSNPVTLINESSNSSVKSMQAAFKVLALIDPGRGGRRIAVLGNMLNLGDENKQVHDDLALPLKAANVDLVYTCGKRMRKIYDNLPANQKGAHKDSSEELAKIVPDVLMPGDVVMVKGSLNSKMNTVVEALRALPFKFKKTTERNY